MDREPHSVVSHGDKRPSLTCDPMSFTSQMTSIPKLPHSTRLLSVDEVMSLVSNANRRESKGGGSGDPYDMSCRSHRIASADGDATGNSQGLLDEYSDLTSDGTLSRCTSTDRISLADGQVEDRFRVDRRKLEAMILGCPPDPCDFEIMRLPIGSDGRILSADDFFARVMATTGTDIRYPRLLKVGARNRKDPHVRVVGTPDNVSIASNMVRAQLEPNNKITMKMDVSWTHHSHIIGKAGNTIQPVVRRTGVSIHFPDGNKNNEIRKSNQVSINSRGEELLGLEEARASIRQLTPLIFTFSLNANAKYIAITEPNFLVQHVQGLYNVQVELSVTGGAEPLLLGSVRGSETDVSRVKEATFTLLQNLCGPIASHLTVQMKIEVSPQHHAFVLGRNNETLRRIMQVTATNIRFPDSSDPSLAPLQRSTVVISGAIDNVYAARQNIVGALPLVLMFEVGNNGIAVEEIAQVMSSFNLSIIPKPARPDGRRPVIIKGAERDASHIYEAWRLVTGSDKKLPTVMIPPSYHIAHGPPTPTALGVNSLGPGWAAPRSRSSSSALSPHPFTQNIQSPFPPPTPTYPPPNTSVYGPSVPSPLLSPLWAGLGGGSGAASTITPASAAGTSFPFPAPSSILYDTQGGGSGSYYSSPSLANLAALSSLAAARSPTSYTGAASNAFLSPNTITTSTNSYFFGSNMTPSSVFNNNNYFVNNKNAAASNALANANALNNNINILDGSVLGRGSMYSLPAGHASQDCLQQQQQQQRVGAIQDEMASTGGSCSSNGVCSPGMISPHDSSPRDSSPDLVVLGHIQSPPVLPHRQQFQQLNTRTLAQQSVPPMYAGRTVADDTRVGFELTGPRGDTVADAAAVDAEQRSRDLTALLCEFTDRRAPGYEKGLAQAIEKLSLSDYEAKQILANKAMREPVGGTVRVPTSNWSGYGFSKSSPSYQMRQQFQNAGLLRKTVDMSNATTNWEDVGDNAAQDCDAEPTDEGGNFASNWPTQLLSEKEEQQQQRQPLPAKGSTDMTGMPARSSVAEASCGVQGGSNNLKASADGRECVIGGAEDEWPSEVKWSTNDGVSPSASAAGRSAASAVDSGMAGSITSSNQASLSLSDPESSDGLGNSGSSACSSYSSGGSAGVRGGAAVTRPLPRLSTSSFSECVVAARRWPATAAMPASPTATVGALDLLGLLQSLGLSQYIDVFNSQEVDLPMFLSLDDGELKELGISAFGHRKRMLIAIKNLTSSLPEFGSGKGLSIPCDGSTSDRRATTNSSTTITKNVSWKC